MPSKFSHPLGVGFSVLIDGWGDISSDAVESDPDLRQRVASLNQVDGPGDALGQDND